MAAEASATTPSTSAPAAAEKEPVVAESPAAAAADPVRWEFRLTADRRRILILVNRTASPEVE